jgi:serine/threonine protein kinase
VTESGKSPTETTAPEYLVCPVDFYKVDPRFTTGQAYIIDFWESFEASDPPADLGIPEAYCSAELVLDKVVSTGSDLWALGCTLFEIRTGRKLFDMFDDDMDSHLYYMVLLLGKLPEPWWTAWKAPSKLVRQRFRPSGSREEVFPGHGATGHGKPGPGGNHPCTSSHHSKRTSLHLRDTHLRTLVYGYGYWGRNSSRYSGR